MMAISTWIISFTHQGEEYQFNPNQAPLQITFPMRSGHRVDTLSAERLTCETDGQEPLSAIFQAFVHDGIWIPQTRREEFGVQPEDRGMVCHPQVTSELAKRRYLRAGETNERADELANECAEKLRRFYKAYLTVWLPRRHSHDATIIQS